MSVVIQKYEGKAITDRMIAAAAELFSSNYGVWGPLAAKNMGVKGMKQGVRIKMSPKKLVEQILPVAADNILARATIGDELVGNIFGTRWTDEDRTMIWITQLCVHRSYRSQGIAKRLVGALREDECCFGILSSHAHAILAVTSLASDFSLHMTRDNATQIMHSCPVDYVRGAKVHGSLFGPVEDGSVSCADTGFWVDHGEPLAALQAVRHRGISWPLGDLPDGHEYLVLVKAKDKK